MWKWPGGTVPKITGPPIKMSFKEAGKQGRTSKLRGLMKLVLRPAASPGKISLSDLLIL